MAHPQNSFGTRGVQWPDHFSNGGTGITKFGPEDRWRYEKAVAAYGKGVWLVGDALHSSENDLSKFWEHFYSITTP